MATCQLLLACSEPKPEHKDTDIYDIGSELSTSIACGDLIVSAENSDKSKNIFLLIYGNAVDELILSGEASFTATYLLSDDDDTSEEEDDVLFVIRVGENLETSICSGSDVDSSSGEVYARYLSKFGYIDVEYVIDRESYTEDFLCEETTGWSVDVDITLNFSEVLMSPDDALSEEIPVEDFSIETIRHNACSPYPPP